jgi:hypothetical protein
VVNPFHAASSPADFNRRLSLGEVAKAKANPLTSPSSPVRSGSGKR